MCRLDRIQSVLNSAARLIYGRTPSDHTTDLLSDSLHWLRVPLRIAYKLCLITYKTLNDRSMSEYFSNFCSRQKATIPVEKSSTRPTVFCEVWRLFLLYRRTHCMEQPFRPCEERLICG